MSPSASPTARAESLSSLPKRVSVAMRRVSSRHRRARFERVLGYERGGKLPRVALHDAGVLGDALAVEGRLHDAAHLAVQRILAGEQSLSQQQREHARSQRLRERVLLRDEHVFHELG